MASKQKQEFGPPMLTSQERARYQDDPTARWKWKANPGACIDCMARDGKVYKMDDIPGRPHPNCKCKMELVASGEWGGEYVPEGYPTWETEDQALWPDYNGNIVAGCTMSSVGIIAGGVHLRCELSTHCWPVERTGPRKFKGVYYRGGYSGLFFGPVASLIPFGWTTFVAEFRLPGNLERYDTPLHAMHGWGEIRMSSLAVGVGLSLGRMVLGNTVSESVYDIQGGFDPGSSGWFGGRGYLHWAEEYECVINK